MLKKALLLADGGGIFSLATYKITVGENLNSTSGELISRGYANVETSGANAYGSCELIEGVDAGLDVVADVATDSISQMWLSLSMPSVSVYNDTTGKLIRFVPLTEGASIYTTVDGNDGGIFEGIATGQSCIIKIGH